ncbi:unnamed protein product [Periconia digitata]|uniref:Uncharacterized protein n=1 Tax=Periconia digitata TaxID=1303443 RepID=A0A9W4XS34_9PLEO|nr:unnamed protein product [Periconia digitata]
MSDWSPPPATTALDILPTLQEASRIIPPDTVYLHSKKVTSDDDDDDDAPIALQAVAEEHDPWVPMLPSLNYSLYGRRSRIARFALYVFIDSLVLPVGLYFLLWYGFGPGNPLYHPLSASTALTIVTAVIGGTSIWELLLRAWKLAKRDSDCRPVGSSWWHFDWFEWWFAFTWILIITEVSVAFVPDEPDRRMLAMPLPTVLAVFGTSCIIIDVLRYFSVPTPIRVSSMPRGVQLRPGIYPLVEDICSVDGSGTTEFRQNLNRRYAASHIFRVMLRRLSLFWGIGAECCAAVTMGLIFGLDDDLEDYAFAIGWALPFIWAGPWAMATIYYVKRELREETRLWGLT